MIKEKRKGHLLQDGHRRHHGKRHEQELTPTRGRTWKYMAKIQRQKAPQATL